MRTPPKTHVSLFEWICLSVAFAACWISMNAPVMDPLLKLVLSILFIFIPIIYGWFFLKKTKLMIIFLFLLTSIFLFTITPQFKIYQKDSQDLELAKNRKTPQQIEIEFEKNIGNLADEGVSIKDRELQCETSQTPTYHTIEPPKEKIRLKLNWERKVNNALAEYPILERDFRNYVTTYNQFIKTTDTNNNLCPYNECDVQYQMCYEINVLNWIAHQKRE